MKFELSVEDHSSLLDLLWDHQRDQALEALALFCAARWLRGSEVEQVRAQAVELAKASAEARRLWDCLAQQPY